MRSKGEPDMSQYRMSPRFSWKKLAAGFVILDLEKGNYFTLNDTASVIWSGLLDGKAEDAIAGMLVESFDVPLPRAKEDTRDTLSMLVKEGVVESL
jgi:hypothetical protein